MPEIVVFDWGKVLFLYGKIYPALAAELFETEDIDEVRSAVISYDYEVGKIKRAQWLEQIKARFNLEIDIEELNLRMFQIYYENIEMIEETMEVIHEVKSGMSRVAVLSNINSLTVGVIKKKWPGAYSNFQYHFLSYEMGLMKPDHQIFRKMFEELMLPPTDIVFVDDVEENIKAARDVQIRAILFTSPQQLREELFKKNKSDQET